MNHFAGNMFIFLSSSNKTTSFDIFGNREFATTLFCVPEVLPVLGEATLLRMEQNVALIR